MIYKMSIVTLALVAGLAAQETYPEPKVKRRPPQPAPISKPMARAGAKVHVKKMLDLAMELRQGGFEEEAQALIRQAKRLASKVHGRLRKDKGEVSRIGHIAKDPRVKQDMHRILRDVEKRQLHKEHLHRMLKIKLEAERRASARGPVRLPAPDVIDVEEVEIIEEGEARRPRARMGVRTRDRELKRAMAEREMARRRKVDMARRDSDLDARVESLTKQVMEMRDMIQQLKRAIENNRGGERRRDQGPRVR